MKNEPVFESKQQLNDLLGETKVKEFETDHVLKCRFNKQSFCWHQLDLHNSKFYNSRNRWAFFSIEHGEWKVTCMKLF